VTGSRTWRLVAAGIGGLSLLAGVGLGGVILWTDASAVQVTFANDTSHVVALPDCSTDLATLNPHDVTRLPVAWDHPAQCTIDVYYDNSSLSYTECLPMPKSLSPQAVVRISNAVRIPPGSNCPA
jgi:hypothetical protein